MKIKYLGTAAAEGIPALFCECDVCKKARETKGKNIRSRCQLLINDDLLLDYPPDSFYHFIIYNIDLSHINNLLISHVHEDHFYPLDFSYFRKGYSVIKNSLPFTIYGSVDLKEPLESIINHPNNQGLRYQEIKPYQTCKIGNYLVTPLEASHGTNNPYIYIISDGNKTMLYYHDSGPLKDNAFNYLINNKICFDLLSLDCTAGTKDIYWTNHMCVNMVRDLVKKFKDYKLINEKTKIVLNHFSHNGGDVLFDNMNNAIKKDGFIVSFDGLEINL